MRGGGERDLQSVSVGGQGAGFTVGVAGEGFTALQEGGVGVFQWQLRADNSGQLRERLLEGGPSGEGFTALQEGGLGAFQWQLRADNNGSSQRGCWRGGG